MINMNELKQTMDSCLKQMELGTVIRPTIKTLHEEKNWFGKIVDWFKWKTPFAKRSHKIKYRPLKCFATHDIKAIYIDTFRGWKKYQFKRGKAYEQYLENNPYYTFAVQVPLVSPVNYIKIDFTI